MPQRPPTPPAAAATETATAGNQLFAKALAATQSPSGAPGPMSRQELAEAANAELARRGVKGLMTDKDIGRFIRGETRWPRDHYRAALRTVLSVTSDRELGFYPNRKTTTSVVTGQRPQPPDPGTELSSTGTTAIAGPLPVAVDGIASTVLRDQLAGEGTGDEVYRREVPMAGAVIAGNAVLPVPEQRRMPDGLAEVASALVGTHRPGPTQHWSPEPVGEDVLSTTVTELKGRYQAGKYREVIKALPPLLGNLSNGDAPALRGERWSMLAAGAYQTVCSVLLKLGDHALAMLAADRSMTAARRSGDPVTAAASARALAHALAHSGHQELATAVALAAARDVPTDHSARVEDLAVYGALLLRASVIAAAGEDRALAWDVLAEANETAKRVGNEQNLVWTYFCPVNVQLHQVSVAVSLGDAGQAIEHARQVDLRRIPLAERRACFWTDVARAYLQWGKYEQAYKAICEVEQAAPQEVAVRPQVHRVVDELQRRSPPSVRGQVVQLADRIRVAQ